MIRLEIKTLGGAGAPAPLWIRHWAVGSRADGERRSGDEAGVCEGEGSDWSRSKSSERERTHLTAEGGAEESPEVADDVLAAALRLLGGVDAQHHLAGDRLRGTLR